MKSSFLLTLTKQNKNSFLTMDYNESQEFVRIDVWIYQYVFFSVAALKVNIKILVSWKLISVWEHLLWQEVTSERCFIS